MSRPNTARIARLAAWLAKIGNRHNALADRISQARARMTPNIAALRRLEREQQRLESEMQYCTGLLRRLVVQSAA